MSLETIERYTQAHAWPAGYPWVERMVRDIEREVAERYMKLPLDEDGEPVRVGDTLYPPRGEGYAACEVESIEHDGEDWYINCSAGHFNVLGWTHRKRPDVGDVLREYHRKRNENGVARVRGELHPDVDELTAEYADKVREAVMAE